MPDESYYKRVRLRNTGNRLITDPVLISVPEGDAYYMLRQILIVPVSGRIEDALYCSYSEDESLYLPWKGDPGYSEWLSLDPMPKTLCGGFGCDSNIPTFQQSVYKIELYFIEEYSPDEF